MRKSKKKIFIPKKRKENSKGKKKRKVKIMSK